MIQANRLLPSLLSVVLVCVLLVASTAPAVAQSSDSSDQLYEDMKPLVKEYNDNLDQVPGTIKNQLGGEQVEVVVMFDDKEAVYSVSMADDGSITSFENTPVDNPTMRVKTTADAIYSIKDAENKQFAFWNVYDAGDFKITGLTPGNNVKITAAKILTGIFRFLGL